MHPRRFALIGGIIMLALGLLALVPSFNMVPVEGLPLLKVENSYGIFAGLVTWNIVNKLVSIVVGALGIAAAYAPATSLPKSIAWARLNFALMGILAVMGLIPSTATLFGYAPIFGNDVILNGVVSLIGAYFGFALTARAEKPTPENLRKRQAVAGM